MNIHSVWHCAPAETHLWMLMITVGPACLTTCGRGMMADHIRAEPVSTGKWRLKRNELTSTICMEESQLILSWKNVTLWKCLPCNEDSVVMYNTAT